MKEPSCPMVDLHIVHGGWQADHYGSAEDITGVLLRRYVDKYQHHFIQRQ